MAESLCYPPETITTLFIGYTAIQNKKFKKKKNKTLPHWHLVMPILEALSPQGTSVGTSVPHTLSTHLASLDFSAFLPNTCILSEYHHQANVLISRCSQKQVLHPVPRGDFDSIT